MTWLQHLPIVPIALPMFCGALMLFLKEKRRRMNTVISFFSVLVQLATALTLFLMSNHLVPSPWLNRYGIAVYLLGNWQAPFGIVLVVDQLSSLMLCLSAFLSFGVLTYSTAVWNKVGIHFYPLFQFILMGLNGAFLTGDFFNLFVFFEIFLAASYGLILHGSGRERVSASMHYITVNLIGASLLLISISMLYAITGTLNMADLASRASKLTGQDRMLFETACSLLAVAFLVKAAAWPLNFWLPNAYAAASSPVAALFAILTKVGIYALLRVGSLLLPAGAPTAFGGQWMYYIGLATILFGMFGMLNEKQTGRIVGFAVITSSGTLLTSLGVTGASLTGPSLYYMVSSVLTIGAFYFLVELIKRTENYESNVLSVSMEAFGLDEDKDTDYSGQVVGIALPAGTAFLGLTFFICALVIAGMPPLSGFLGKIAILNHALNLKDIEIPAFEVWLLLVAMVLSGLATVIAMSRMGIRLFWVPNSLKTPVLSLREIFSVLWLLLPCILMSLFANPLMELFNRIAVALDNPNHYIQTVLHFASMR